MFGSGFAETSDASGAMGDETYSNADDAASEAPSFSSSKWTRHFEDSDDEDDDMLVDDPTDSVFASASSSQIHLPSRNPPRSSSAMSLTSPMKDTSEDSATVGSDNENDNEGRNVRPKLSHPSSPGITNQQLERPDAGWQNIPPNFQPTDPIPGPNKLHVVVKDVAYTTYLAVLHYVIFFFNMSMTPSVLIVLLALHRHYRFCAIVFIFQFQLSSCHVFCYIATFAKSV